MDDILDDVLGAPIRGLEIDVKTPAYILEDYGVESDMVESRALDVSFGRRKVVVSVTKRNKWSK